MAARTPGASLSEVSEAHLASLESAGRSPNTLLHYGGAAEQLAAWLTEQRLSLDIADVRPEHVERFLSHRRKTISASSARSRWAGLRPLFRFAKARGFVEVDIFTLIPRPTAPTPILGIPREEEIAALLAACDGGDFLAIRDKALIALLIDSGARRSEVARMRLDDVDLLRGTVVIRAAKNHRDRFAMFGDGTRAALRRWLRVREKAFIPGRVARTGRSDPGTLFVGLYGEAMVPSGNSVWQAVRRRGRAAGLTSNGAWCHQLRRAFAHASLSAGLDIDAVATLGGWSTTALVSRYAAGRREERARAAYRSPLDAFVGPAREGR